MVSFLHLATAGLSGPLRRTLGGDLGVSHPAAAGWGAQAGGCGKPSKRFHEAGIILVLHGFIRAFSRDYHHQWWLILGNKNQQQCFKAESSHFEGSSLNLTFKPQGIFSAYQSESDQLTWLTIPSNLWLSSGSHIARVVAFSIRRTAIQDGHGEKGMVNMGLSP